MINQEVTVTGVAASDWIAFRKWESPIIAIQIEPNGGTVTIEGTIDSAVTPGGTVVSSKINPIGSLSDITAQGLYTAQGPLTGIRINQTVGATTATLTVLQSDA